MTIFAPSVRRGAQKPRVASVPAYASSSGVEACELAASVGVNLDPWQRLFVTDCLGERLDGKWSAREAGLLVARQNGKGEILLALGLAGLFLLDERLILHSAHEFKTAAEAFLRIKTVVDGSDDLRRQVKMIRTSHGEEGIELIDGRRLRFVARSKSSGRGFTGDRIILDEAQQLPMRAVRALIPTLRARPNPQVVYTGTVPSAENDSEHWQSVRDRGRDGSDPRLLWHEYSPPGAERGAVDPDDRDNWYATNPALGIRITEEDMQAERETFKSDPEGFAAELLSVWPDGSVSAVIDPLVWLKLADLGADPAPHVGRLALGVDSDPLRLRTSIVVAGERADGVPLVEVIENLPGVDWAEAFVRDLCARNDVRSVVIDKRGAAASLIGPLSEAKVPVYGTTAAEMAQACGQFFDAATETGRLRHLGQASLDEALKGASTRPLGDAWAWDRRRPSADITPLTAATLALWGFASGQGVAKNAGRGRVVALT